MKKFIVGKTICWKCKKGRVTLRKCMNGLDYVCESCSQIVGLDGPEIGNQSRYYFEEKK